MTGYELRMFHYCRRLNDAAKRGPDNWPSQELFGIGLKDDRSLESLIKWANKNKQEALKNNFNNYSRFLK